MNEKKLWCFAGLFMILLVLSMPFYSANVMAASVQITKNQGEDGIKNYIDAQGDVWTVEALISGTGNETVNPDNVKVKIGENEASFQSCTPGTLGLSCEYISPLTEGVSEAEHAFQVVYNFLNILGQPDSISNGDYIRADGSAPTINFFPGNVRQNEKGEVLLDFTVTDRKEGIPAVGLKQIDIIDADSGAVLQSIADFEEGQETFSYAADTSFGGKLQAQLTGEGKKRLKISAEDRLGHKEVSKAVSFDTDFVKPEIRGTFNLTKFGDFIGQYNADTDVIVDIVETSEPKVSAYSDQAGLKGQVAECDSDAEEDNLWHCNWKDIEVKPESTINILFVAVDESGNKLEQTLSRTFVVDNTPPVVKFFGTNRQFEDQSFINGKNVIENKIILKASDEGAGISAEGIRANLNAFGLSNAERPDECEEVEGELQCFWKVNYDLNEGVLLFGLSTFKDNVGNEGEMPESQFFVDNTGPKVEKIEIYGLSEAGAKNYFQSNDILQIKLTVSESSGLNILVDLNDFVMDAETKFVEDEFTLGLGNGWQRFTEDSCEKLEGKWECVVETEAIKSGPAKETLEIKVQDTAGNDASAWPEEIHEPKNVERGKEGSYLIDIAGLATEDNPDYWEVDKTRALLPFVDLDTTQISYTRIPIEIKLKSDNSKAKILAIQMVGCEVGEGELVSTGAGNETAGVEEVVETAPAASGPEISRAILFGTNFPDGQASPVATSVIMEFKPFNGRQMFGISGGATFDQANVKYTCQMKVYSKVGKFAMQYAEMQEVTVEVPFAFSALGSLDETLSKKVTDLQESGLMTFFDVIHVIYLIVKWIGYIGNILQILLNVIEIIDVVSATLNNAAEPAEDSGFLAAAGEALKGNCLSTQLGSSVGISEYVAYIQVPIQILNCNPSAQYSDLGFYGKWQRSVLDFYNMISLRGAAGVPADSLYENMYASIIGLCLPGILYNIEKAREVHCRRIVCYGREVPAGLATMESCEQLFDLQMCEFVWGPIIEFIPGVGLAQQIGQMLKSMFTSPLGLISYVEVIACAPLCFSKTSAALTACKIATVTTKLLGIVNSIVDAVQNRPDVTESYYCNMADDIDPEQLTGQIRG